MSESSPETTAAQLFESLKLISDPPTEEIFNQVDEKKAEITPLLLTELEQFSNDVSAIQKKDKDYIRHIVSLFVLAYFQEKQAYPHIIKLISYPDDKVVKVTGEVFTEALGRILASVYDGQIGPVKTVIENPRLNPWLRAGALDSLMVLWKENVLTRDEIISYLKELMESKLEKQSSYVWDTIALIAYDLHPEDLQFQLQEAIQKKLIDPIVLNEESLASCLKNNLIDTIHNKENVVEGYIKEPIKELTWWLYPDEEALDKGMEYASLAVPMTDKKIVPGERGTPMGWRLDTVVRSTKKMGRNEPCYCGSGKKYKKCCGGNS